MESSLSGVVKRFVWAKVGIYYSILALLNFINAWVMKELGGIEMHLKPTRFS